MIEQEPQTGGRSCGHLVDTENCKLRDCDEFTWVVSLVSIVVVFYNS